jgi:hypothetical protein
MSSNGPNHSEFENPPSPTPSHSPTLTTRQEPTDSRSSFDSDRSSSPSVTTNGVVNGRKHSTEDDSDPISKLKLQLERTKEEKEALAAQYRTLLAKLTTMKTSLGNKLKQDAVCGYISLQVFLDKFDLSSVLAVVGGTRPTGTVGAAADCTK